MQNLNPARIVVSSFGVIILLGTLLLMLPVASRVLRDRSYSGGHLGALDPVWTGGHSGDDPAWRSGVYDGHYPGLLCPPAQDRALRAAHHGLHTESQRYGRGGPCGAPRSDGYLPDRGDRSGRYHAVLPAEVWIFKGPVARDLSRRFRFLQRGVRPAGDGGGVFQPGLLQWKSGRTAYDHGAHHHRRTGLFCMGGYSALRKRPEKTLPVQQDGTELYRRPDPGGRALFPAGGVGQSCNAG